MSNTETAKQVRTYEEWLRQGRAWYRTERAARDYAKAMFQESK